MTTHVAVWCPERRRLYWASDRKYTFGDSRRYDRFFESAPKQQESEQMWAAGAGGVRECRSGGHLVHQCATAEEFIRARIEIGRCDMWPTGEDAPEFLVCDAEGLWLVNTEPTLIKARPWMPISLGSGRRYAAGATLALMPTVPNAGTDWQWLVRRVLHVACECDEGSEGVDSGVWSPGPAVVTLPEVYPVAERGVLSSLADLEPAVI